MTVAERIADIILEEAITIKILRQTMEQESVNMETAANIWRERLTRYATKHTEEVGWLHNIDATEWKDPDNEDEVAEAVDQAATAGYIEGYIDGFTDSLRARGIK